MENAKTKQQEVAEYEQGKELKKKVLADKLSQMGVDERKKAEAELDEAVKAMQYQQNNDGEKNRNILMKLVEAARNLIIRLVNFVRRIFALPPLGYKEVESNNAEPQYSFDAPEVEQETDQDQTAGIDDTVENKAQNDVGDDNNEEDDEKSVIFDIEPTDENVANHKTPGNNTANKALDPESRQYNLFSDDALVSSLIEPGVNGLPASVNTTYKGEIAGQGGQVMHQALKKLDGILGELLNDPKLYEAEDPAEHFADKVDINQLSEPLHEYENALVNELVSQIGSDGTETEGQNETKKTSQIDTKQLESAARAIISSLPRSVNDTVKVVLPHDWQREKALGYLRSNTELVENYLVNRSTVASIKQFLPAKSQTDNEQIRDDVLSQLKKHKASTGEALSVGRLTPETLDALEQDSDLEFDERGLLKHTAPKA